MSTEAAKTRREGTIENANATELPASEGKGGFSGIFFFFFFSMFFFNRDRATANCSRVFTLFYFIFFNNLIVTFRSGNILFVTFAPIKRTELISGETNITGHDGSEAMLPAARSPSLA